MGSDLPPQAGQKPMFAVWAMRDPQGANLDRIQIVKGWVDASGNAQEKVYDAAWSGQRTRGPGGKVIAVGNTVDVEDASYTNTIGAQQLKTVWIDRDFEPGQEAFYYARVLEIPTPRWTTFDAKTLGIEAPEPAYIQERAVTSAIWYSTPGHDQ